VISQHSHLRKYYKWWHRRLACAELPAFAAQAARQCQQTHVLKQPLNAANITPTHPAPRAARGVGIAILVVVLAAVTLVVLGTISTGADDAHAAAGRAQALRARLAAESGAFAMIKLRQSNLTLPPEGSTITIGDAVATFVAVPAGAETHVNVNGTSGTSVQRIAFDFE
jgi:hypothetical protein